MELLVVIAIMGLFSGMVIANLAGQRRIRNLKIAQNEMVSTIRKVQSYALSSRSLPGNIGVKYYVVFFDTATPTTYKIQAIDQNYAFQSSVETSFLPVGIQITRLQLQLPVGTTASPDPGCVQLVYSLPFSRVYMQGKAAGTCGSDLVTAVQDAQTLANKANGLLTITFADIAALIVKTVTVNAASGIAIGQ